MTDAFHDPPIDSPPPPISTSSTPGAVDPQRANAGPGSGSAWAPPPAEDGVIRPGWLGPLAAFAAGFVITALAAWIVIRVTHRAGVEACRAEAIRSLSKARMEFQSAVDGVDALAAFLSLGEAPNPSQFDAFAARILAQCPALAGVAWEPFVDSANLPAVETLIRRRTGEETSIWCPPPPGGDGRRTRPAPQRVHAPLAYVHPVAPFMAVHGLDILSPTVQYPFQDTLLRAEPTVWGPLTLPWVAGSPRAVFVTSPIVAGPVAASGAAAGFILVDPILAKASEFPSHPHMRLEIVTPESQAPSFPGFSEVAAPAARPRSTGRRQGPALVYEETMNIGGQKLTMRAVGDPAYFLAGRDRWVWTVLAAGSFCSLLLASFVGSRTRAARRIRAQRRELESVNSSLRESDERFRLALQAVDGIVYYWNAAENRAIRSGGLLTGLGYIRELPSTLEAWLEIIHPEDRAGALAHFQRALDSDATLSVEYRIRHAEGRYVEVWDRGVVIRGPDGQARRIVGCTISLAEQRRAERAVREANARFAEFADAINDVLWTVELNPRRVVYINPAFERVWGIPREAVYQDPDAWLEAVLPEDLARVKDLIHAWERPGTKGARQVEYRIRRADGEVRWIQDTSVRIDDPAGRVVRVVGIAKDITSRKQILLDLEESEEAYRQLFESNLAVKLIFDSADGAIVQVNKAAAEYYGYPKARFQTMNIRDLCAHHAYDEWREKHKDEVGAIRLESEHRLADGEVREVEIFGTTLQRKGRTLKYLLIHDISERKRAERDLETSRRTLEQAQAVGRIGSWVSDATPEGRLLWSSQVFRIFGIPPDEFDQRISTFFRLVHPDDLEQVKVATAEAIRTRSVYRIDHRIVRPDGEIRWVLEQGEVECDPDGTPVRIVGVVQDITERHEAEQALRDSQERLRTTLDSLAEGCLVLDATGAFVDCNRPAEKILGVSREVLLSRNIEYSAGWKVFNEDGTPLQAEEYPASVSLRTGRSVDGRVVGMIAPGGAALWISMNSRPLYDAQGVIRGAVVSFADIAERRAASIALQQTAKRYQLLFDANPEPLWVYDAKTLRFLAVNQAAVESYGYSKEEFFARTILDIRPPDERTRLEEHLLTIGADSARLRATWVHQIKSGALIDVEVISHPITFEGREARIVLAKDVTERVRAERALRESESRLREAQRIGSFGDWEYDIAADRITWSDEVYRLFHRDPADGPPATFDENLRYYAPQDAERLAAAVRDAVDHARGSQVDLQVALPDGSRHWHRGVIRVVTDEQGRVVRLKGIVQDITQRKLAEEALRATQLRLATILEHLPDVVVYESDGEHIFPSDNMVRLIGYPAETFSHDRAAFTQLVHPADLQIAERRIRQLRAARDTEALVLQYRLRHRAGHYVWIEDRMVYEYDPHGGDRLLGVLIDITERKRSEQRQRLMMSELDHRVKNNLATVISLLEQTGRTAKSQAAFHQTFLGRLQALARMHKALSRTHWEGVGLRPLVSQTLEAYQSDPPGRVQIIGDDVTLPARAASPLAMALHELATNAVKYGALSVPQGSVRVEWTLADSEGVPHLSLLWTESGGPPVTPPDDAGFGSELIQGGIAYELHGEARIEFDPSGVRCYMNIPLHAHPPVLPSLLDSV